jgi:hypothetical protein
VPKKRSGRALRRILQQRSPISLAIEKHLTGDNREI